MGSKLLLRKLKIGLAKWYFPRGSRIALKLGKKINKIKKKLYIYIYISFGIYTVLSPNLYRTPLDSTIKDTGISEMHERI